LGLTHPTFWKKNMEGSWDRHAVQFWHRSQKSAVTPLIMYVQWRYFVLAYFNTLVMYPGRQIYPSCSKPFICYGMLFALRGLILLCSGKQLMDVTSSPTSLLPWLHNKRVLGIRNNGFECGEFHAALLAGQTTNSRRSLAFPRDIVVDDLECTELLLSLSVSYCQDLLL
jgi:hypothetical protein